MIFKSLTKLTDQYDFESYKERNFYYKVFSGYLFNELIPGINDRKRQFYELLLKSCGRKEYESLDALSLVQNSREAFLDQIQVTFDFHPTQWDKKPDHGEMSDIVIWMKGYFYSIEVKFLSNWSFEKDILSVQRRITRVQNLLMKEASGNKMPLQILLVSNVKWSRSDDKEGNVDLLRNSRPEIPVVVLFWEEIEKLVQNEPLVAEFIKHRLAILT